MLRSLSTQSWPPKPTFTGAEVPTQPGKVFMVTGGSMGIGYELCQLLYGTGATVYMASRNKEKAEAAIQAITSAAAATMTPGTLRFLPLDLSDLATVREAARLLAASESRLDVLWLNAGMGPQALPAGSRTARGVDSFMFNHCVAHLLLAHLLRPLLERASSPASPARVVWTASAWVEVASPPGGVDFSALVVDPAAAGASAKPGGHTSADATRNYAASKVGIFLAREMARRWGGGDSGILSVCQNPGNLRTSGFDSKKGMNWFIEKLKMVHPPIYGAYTSLFSGLSPAVTREHNGSYVIPWGRLVDWDKDMPHKRDIAGAMRSKEGGTGAAARFWDWCESRFNDA